MKTKRKYTRRVKPTNAVAAPTLVSKSGGYNQQNMLNLWADGKSVAEIAKVEGCSPVYARRVLQTKAPELYKAGLAARHAAPAASLTSTKEQVVAAAKTIVNGGNGKAGIVIGNEAITLIARAVAAEALRDAKVTIPDKSRTEIFNDISKGVKTGLKTLGIGFHA